jgi:UDP-N-acetylmuramoyl-tripeptide--D-alanyl-D-alanine ligase
MKPMSLAEIRRVTDAADLPAGAGDLEIGGVSTDSKQISPNALFIALRGERFDGHNFVGQAATNGATAAIVDRPAAESTAGMQLLRVADTRLAMGRLARHVRRQLHGKVIAVAGSNGKTGTKHLIDSALRDSLHGSISPKSFNNDIGVPLAIFPADPEQDYLVLELGTNHPGEIRTLTQIALPDIAVITNCSAEHLEGLGDVEGVRSENASIVEGLNPNGPLIVNGDDPELLQAVAGFRGDCVTFGFLPGNEIWASRMKCDWNGVHFTIEPAGIEAFVPLLGKHTAVNALAAIAIGRVMGLPDRQIVRGLASTSGPDMRLQRMEAEGVKILNDAYNANPASMKAAIETLASLPAAARKIAVLGEMRELGPASVQCHREVGRFVAEKCSPDMLICVGPEAMAIASEAVKFGMPAHRVAHFTDVVSAHAMASRFMPGDLILLKASRAIGLESMVRAIVSSRPHPLAAAS